MKNQYFGDINDYLKYGLLRALQSEIAGGLLVAWMLTPDDGGGDGALRSYLEDPARWKRHDPELFTGLAQLLDAASAPDISLIEGSSLLPGASHYTATVPDGRGERKGWREGLLAAAREADLVFLDPDNGIEVPSKPVGRKGSSKFITWEEIRGVWEVDCSILVYQHFPRESRDAFVGRMVAELRDHTAARYATAVRTARVLFLLAGQERHERALRAAVSSLQRQWRGLVEPVEMEP